MGTRGLAFSAALVAATVAGVGAATAAPTADFTWSPTQPAPGQTVTFTAQTSPDVVRYQWDLDPSDNAGFVDGGSTASRAFDTAGTYRIRLRVFDSAGERTTRSRDVTVSNDIRASFTWSPAAPVDGDTVTLTSTSTPAVPITSWLWDLDNDGRFNDASGQQVQKSFPVGAYTVGLRVEDDDGNRSTQFETINVAEKPPPAPPPPPAQKWLDPFPSVRVRGQAYAGGARLSLVAVRAPLGSNVEVRCRGSKRCPRKRDKNYVMQGERLRLQGHERFYPDGTILQIFIWKPGEVGKYSRFRIRKLVAPVRTDRCLYPGGKWPGRCPR